MVSQGLELLKKLEKHTYHEQPIKLLAKAEGISKAYRAGKFALKNIDFTINSGEIVGILWAKMAMVKRLFCVI
jgi:ABC-type polysaccharide/polyol phosphate transport system ATPase subunit